MAAPRRGERPTDGLSAQRHHGAGATSARAYLLTVLGEYVLPNGGRVWTATLIDALQALGVEEKTVRQVVARSAGRGLLHRERVGRRTRWHLTDQARALLTEGTERIYTFHHKPLRWDGRWLLLFTTVPETRRELRYRLRIRLGWSGFAPIAPGAWLSPWAGREAEAKEVLAELELLGAARSFVGTLGAIGIADDVVATAWDLDRVGAEYETFIERYRRLRPVSPPNTFVALTRMVHEWRRFPFMDPDLPLELLPRRWSGHRAADLFHRRHDEWKDDAWAWWRDRSTAADG